MARRTFRAASLASTPPGRPLGLEVASFPVRVLSSLGMAEEPWAQETRDFETAPQGAEWERLQLVVVQEASSRVVPLHSGPFTIGRAPEADLVIDDVSISRLHTRLLVTDQRVVLSDLGSRNGTLLNGAPVREPRPIAPGDVITLG